MLREFHQLLKTWWKKDFSLVKVSDTVMISSTLLILTILDFCWLLWVIIKIFTRSKSQKQSIGCSQCKTMTVGIPLSTKIRTKITLFSNGSFKLQESLIQLKSLIHHVLTLLATLWKVSVNSNMMPLILKFKRWSPIWEKLKLAGVLGRLDGVSTIFSLLELLFLVLLGFTII